MFQEYTADLAKVLDYKTCKYDDAKTWDLIGSGDTVGVFQLESNTGRKWAREVKPRNLEELAALVALIRPGCLQAKMEDGKSLTEHYVMRKNGKEMVDYLHPKLQPILKHNYGILVMQEEAIRIGQELAGMDLKDSDKFIRYALGKKRSDLIEEGKQIFIDGCIKNGIEETIARQIFSWIEAGQRYSFNACLGLYNTVIVKTDGEISWKEIYIKDVKIGDFVLAPNNKMDEPHIYVKVVNIFNNGKKPLYSVVFDHYYTIQCTLDHKFLCSDSIIRPLWEIIKYQHEIISHYGKTIVAAYNFIGWVDTIDLSVESDDHLFFCNGLATSNSHACAFAQHAYASAYLKAHYPMKFFQTYLKHAKHRLNHKDEIRRLVQNARSYDITIYAPDLRFSEAEFEIVNNRIYAGLTDIKHVGKTDYAVIDKYRKELGQPSDFFDFLQNYTKGIKSNALAALIQAGALDFLHLDRKYMSFVLERWQILTDLQKEKIKEFNSESLEEALEKLIEFVNKPTKIKVTGILAAIRQPPYKLVTAVEEIEKTEIELVGAPLTRSRLDESKAAFLANVSAKKLTEKKYIKEKEIVMVGFVADFREITTKKKDQMAFMSLEDQTGICDDMVVFPETFNRCRINLVKDLLVIVKGRLDYKTKGLIVEDIIEI
jgi:DNA polymerase III alpha subunit